jgi:arabinofuranosyltransferase
VAPTNTTLAIEHALDSQSLRPGWQQALPYARFLCWALFALVLIRTAWIADDAYITFRSVDNVVNGFGPVYNIDERVQAFSNPLWMMVHLPVQALFHDPYWSTLLLSFAMSIITLRLLARRLESSAAAIALPLVGISSKALIEFSSSGLENPLTALLLVGFLILFVQNVPTRRHLFKLSLLAGLLMLNRMDNILLVAPALGIAFWQSRSWRSALVVFYGFIPLLLWVMFSTVYYGFPFPNTFYAKLGAGIPQNVLWRMGLHYFLDSLRRDPITLPLILLGLLVTVRRRRQWPIAIGIVLYLVYIGRIGGDFMSGRFLTTPLWAALFLIGDWIHDRKILWILLAAVTTIVGLMGPTPMLLSGADYRLAESPFGGKYHVADERSYYYHGTGLLPALKSDTTVNGGFASFGKNIRNQGGTIVETGAIGFTGFYGGTGNHIIDNMALSDPLLARMPAIYEATPRAGHFARMYPKGYWESIQTRDNQIADPAIHDLYEKLRIVTQGPIFSAKRFEMIWKLNTGAADLMPLDHVRVPAYVEYQLPLRRNDTITFPEGEGAKFILPTTSGGELDFKVLIRMAINLIWLKEGTPIGSARIDQVGRVLNHFPVGTDAFVIVPVNRWPPTFITEINYW